VTLEIVAECGKTTGSRKGGRGLLIDAGKKGKRGALTGCIILNECKKKCGITREGRIH